MLNACSLHRSFLSILLDLSVSNPLAVTLTVSPVGSCEESELQKLRILALSYGMFSPLFICSMTESVTLKQISNISFKKTKKVF